MSDFASQCGPWFDPSDPMNRVKPWRPSVDDLERLLNSETDVAIQILPNGEVVPADPQQPRPKVLTMRENLGGEYAERWADLDRFCAMLP